jgi:ATP-binding cassette, subfamily C (CFTR/MRP), member 1
MVISRIDNPLIQTPPPDRRSGPDLQRLDAVSRSSVQASVVEALDGSATIKMLGQMPNFLANFHRVVDINSSALLNFVTAQRWLGFRIEILGSVVVLVASVLLTSLNDVYGIDVGLVGLLIIWSSNFTVTLGFLVDTFGEAEAAITAVERVDAMARLPQENERVTEKGLAIVQSWPESGELIFRDVTLRYRPGLPLALAG